MPTARTSWSAWYLLALATLVFACLGQAGSALAGGSIPCDPEPTDMPILYSDAVSCSIDPPGDVDIFRFLGTAGDVVTVRASRVGGGNPCVELFDPGGGQVDDICGASVARLDAILGQTGLYSILASENGSSGGNQVMDYTLVVERVAPPSPPATYICPGCEHQGSIDPGGDLDLFFFFGTAGDVISVLASRLGGGNPCVELFDPGGGQVDDICGASVAGIDATLGQTGLYSILASENGSSGGNQVMDYTLSYQCIVGACIDIFIFADGFESGDTTAWSGSVP